MSRDRCHTPLDFVHIRMWIPCCSANKNNTIGVKNTIDSTAKTEVKLNGAVSITQEASSFSALFPMRQCNGMKMY